jgi:hypothetical protein
MIEVGAQLLVLGLEPCQSLLLDEDCLRHGVGRIGLLAQLFGNETFGFRIARLVRHLLEPAENVGDDLTLLIVHGKPPSRMDHELFM